MNTLKKFLVLVIGLPIGLILTTMICTLTVGLWLIFLPWKLIDYAFKINSENLQIFEEFIFACYGLGGLCTIVPLTMLGDETYY